MLVSGREWMNQLKPKKKNRNEKQLSLHDSEPAEGSCGYRMLCGDYPNLSCVFFVLNFFYFARANAFFHSALRPQKQQGLLGTGEDGGRRRSYTYHYTVTTRMTPALRRVAMSANLMFH